jgi:hypothetical protein
VNWFSFTQLPVGVTLSHSPAALSNEAFQGKLFCRELLTQAGIKMPGKAIGVEVYSLQGKKLLQFRINGHWNSVMFETFKKQLPSGMFYLKVLVR